MEHLLQQIEEGLENNLYFLSLFCSLTIPDICGALESENGEASKSKYIAWFNTNVSKSKNSITGEDCYFYRCSMLHQGSSQHNGSSFKRILFIEPNASQSIFHNNIIDDALNIDIRIFCLEILKGARTWLALNKDTERFVLNSEKFVQRYDKGLDPYFVGLPVIS